MSQLEPMSAGDTRAVEILSAALEEARQGRITNLALLTFDAQGVHQRACVDSQDLDPAAVQRIVAEIEDTARGLVRDVKGMNTRRAA